MEETLRGAFSTTGCGLTLDFARNRLFEINTVVTPDTLLRWYRRLIAKKYDGSNNRTVGRPKTVIEIEELILQMARQNRPGATPEFEANCSIWGMRLAATRSSEFSLKTAWIPLRFEEK